MKKYLRSRRAAIAYVAVFAAIGAVTVGVYAAAAARGFDELFFVSIFEPVEDGETVVVNAYTQNMSLPPAIPIGVRSLVSDAEIRGVTGLESVQTVLGGDVDEANGRITGEAQSVDATLVHDGVLDEYFAVVNARLLDFTEVSDRGANPFLRAADFIRTAAIYYTSTRTVSNIGGLAEIGIEVNIRDLADVDTDGNLIPNATALLQRSLLLIGPNGDICFVIALDDLLPLRGGVSSDVEFDLSFDTASGPITIEMVAPSLDTMQAAAGGALDAFDTARLIVGISQDPVDLLDGPEGVSPLAEFDLTGPAPQNLFARVNVAFATVGTRGTTPDWSFAGADVLPGGLLPSGLEMEVALSGPGIAAVLSDGVEVGVYTYAETMSQVDDDIFADGDEEGWIEEMDVTLSNEFNGDDDADARVVIADDGDDTIVVSSRAISAIYASNAVPSFSGSGGGGSDTTCFIATAAYGTPMAAELNALRGVRDGYMLTNVFGSVFADAYYRLSPPIAGEVSQSESLRQAVRAALTPVVAASRWVLASPGSVAGVALLLVALGVVSMRRRRA